MYNRIRTHEPWLLPYVPQDGDVAIDVGAATGTWTLDLAARFDLVMAIEPHAKQFMELQKRLALEADEESYISTFNYAISNQRSRRPMRLTEDPEKSSFFERDEIDAVSGETTEVFFVETTTLDAVIRDTQLEGHGIDFVKVDTEGAEVLVLEGAEQVIRDHQPTFLVEYHTVENGLDLDRFFPDYEKFELITHPHDVVGHGWFYASRK